MSKFYITTTLPYVNAEIHIGHTLEFIQADVIARYKRIILGKENVFFNIGTDEHGLKIYEKSIESGMEVKSFVEKYANRVKEFCTLFGISYDFFYRTSEDYHTKVAQSFWEKSFEKGDIYKKKYAGQYCVGCENFKTQKELIDGKCLDHGKEPIYFEEENYFFRLSKYKEKLLNYIKNNGNFIKPSNKIKELENFVKDMEDISISRLKSSLPWGISVPQDPTQVIYVWFDALSNYVGAIGFPNDMDRFFEFWPVVQICGPDNLRFQGAIWQGMLSSVGFDFSKNILVHGMIYGPDGQKMSKTLGNIISPFEQLEKYGYEAIRYYMINNIPTYGNASYKEEDLINTYNSCLADAFGNLLNRVIQLSNKKNVVINNIDKVSDDIKNYVYNIENSILDFYDNFELQEACNLIHKLSIYGNKYIDDNKPRDKSKGILEIEIILNNTSFILQKICELYAPIIPNSCIKAQLALSSRENIILFNKI